MDPVMKAALQRDKVTIDPSLRLYMLFNEGTGNVAKDYSQQGNNGKFTDVEWGINGCEFNGSSSYANCGNDSSLDITEALTIMAWVKISLLSARMGFLTRGGATQDGYYIFIETGGDTRLITNQVGVSQITFSYKDLTSLDTWYHIVWVREGESVSIYIDGVDRTDPGRVGTHINPASASRDCNIGKYSAEYFNGTISSVKIYDRALSALEILNDYEAERGRYEV